MDRRSLEDDATPKSTGVLARTRYATRKNSATIGCASLNADTSPTAEGKPQSEAPTIPVHDVAGAEAALEASSDNNNSCSHLEAVAENETSPTTNTCATLATHHAVSRTAEPHGRNNASPVSVEAPACDNTFTTTTNRAVLKSNDGAGSPPGADENINRHTADDDLVAGSASSSSESRAASALLPRDTSVAGVGGEPVEVPTNLPSRPKICGSLGDGAAGEAGASGEREEHEMIPKLGKGTSRAASNEQEQHEMMPKLGKGKGVAMGAAASGGGGRKCLSSSTDPNFSYFDSSEDEAEKEARRTTEAADRERRANKRTAVRDDPFMRRVRSKFPPIPVYCLCGQCELCTSWRMDLWRRPAEFEDWDVYTTS